MQRVKKLLLSLLFFVVFSFLGIAVGFGVGYVITILSNEGLFSSWESLDGSLKVESIVEATSQAVWVRTVEEKLYYWDFNCYRNPICNEWIFAHEIPGNLHNGGEMPVKKGNDCQSLGFEFRYYRKPPGHVVECARGWFAGPEFGVVVYYALLEDGKIWAWNYSSSMIFDIVFPIYLSFGGLILGIIAFIVFMLRRRRKNKKQEITDANK